MTSHLVLPQSLRIKRKDHFDFIFRANKKRYGTFLILHYILGTEETQTAFIAGKRVGNAVKRNKAKRILKERFRTIQHSLLYPSHLIFIAKDTIFSSCVSSLNKDLNSLFSSIGLLHEPH